MRYGQIRRYDIANGVGIRSSVFVTGCTRHCPECFNTEYQDFHAGKPWTEAETKLVIQYVSDPNVEGLTLLGGELDNGTLVQGLEDVIAGGSLTAGVQPVQQEGYPQFLQQA